MTTTTTDKPARKSPSKMDSKPKSQKPVAAPDDNPTLLATVAVPPVAPAPKAPTKIDIVLGLLTRAEGATLEQMVEATGWLPHTTRAALTGLKKKGRQLTSSKSNGVRTYRVFIGQPHESKTVAGQESAREA